MPEKVTKIGTTGLLPVFFRSLFIQSSLNFDRMQSLGFAYAVKPALERLYNDEEEFLSRLQVHHEYFNTQPYLAAFVLGAVVRLEEERASGRGPGADIAAMKNSLMGPLGALGDSFFWGSLKPALIIIAVTLLVAGATWAPLLFLVLYNSVHLWIRWHSMVWGYRSSGDLISFMVRYRFTRFARVLKKVTLAVLGALLALVPVWRPEFKVSLPGPGLAQSVAALAVTLALVATARKEGSPVKLMLGLAAFCLALALTGVGE